MISKLLSWVFGILIFSLGILNLLAGNDSDFGVFLVMISFAFYPPVNEFIKKQFKIPVPNWFKIVLAIVLIWINLAVGAIAEGYVF